MDGNSANTIVFIVVLVVGMYMLVIRPNQQRAKQMRELVASLETGKRVMTAGGIWGTLRNVGEDSVEMEISPGVIIELEKAAVAKVHEDETGDA